MAKVIFLMESETMLDLNDREWKTFPLSSIFSTLEPGKGRGLNHLKQTTEDEGISYLGATNRNNGVLCFVEPVDHMIQRGNCVAFIRNGEGSIGYSVYKSENFIASADLTIGYNDKLNRHIGMFITTIADTVRGKYNFNYKRSDARLAKEMLQLPTTKNNVPDWEFMENYIQEREEQLISKYASYATKFEIGGGGKGKITTLDDIKWKEFTLSKLFTINSTSSGIDKVCIKGPLGDYPYLTRTDTNNGINCFIGEQEDYLMDDGNCITIGLDTQTAFFQPTRFYTGQNIQILRNSQLNAFNAKFILPLLKKMLTVFSWGSNGATLTRLKRSKILLPITGTGEPDWNYMEEYVKILMYNRVKTYLNR